MTGGHPLRRYVVGRIAQGVLVVIGAVAVSVVLANLAGNPSDVLGSGLLSPEQRHEIAAQLGYDAPFVERFLSYMGGALHGDLGVSYRTNESAAGIVLTALPYTAALVAGALALSIAVAVPLAIMSVLRRESRLDRFSRRTLMFLGALPDFWVALVLVLIFAVSLNALPSSGAESAASFVLPTIAIALPTIPTFVRLLRGSLLDIARSDFYDALRGKGLSEREIVIRHGLRNASAPFVTLVGLQLGWLLGGTLLVEVVFAWPGIGFTLMDAVSARDIAVIQATVVLTAAGYVVANLIADLVVVYADPRIRVGVGA